MDLLALGEQKYAEEHPLHHAATKDDATLFRRLLQKSELRADIDGDPGSGHDCLQTAIFNGNKEIAEALVTLPLSEFDWTRHPMAAHGAISYLASAATLGRFDIFKIMTDTGNVDIFEGDSLGKTQLHHVSDVPIGQTPFHPIDDEGAVKIARFILEQGAIQVDCEDNKGQTPLSLAAEHGKRGIVQVLLEVSRDPDSKDQDGNSPFYYAVRSGHGPIAELLANTGKVDCGVRARRRVIGAQTRSEDQHLRGTFCKFHLERALKACRI
ncbi:Ankyrin repeat, PH and SEC7 domain containing protein secG [Fusarium oxysporum f. sp. cubense]|uniref:Ankyrin repeat, PH and SEC7 domain containing protein secG n=1 Tax=Fusarium oxysporum f. sp. cubense TaxID=61366 RepID=A0A559LSG5_FUSOC|nr:Ankyrin repeat, PH and SEC7 domain containing protein secG [Fusarium oxysporum f. sp. cubense]